MLRSRILAVAASVALGLVSPGAPVTPAFAGGGFSGGQCPPPGNTIINKIIDINKNVNINKNLNINKNININKNVNIFKPVVINKNVIINKVNASSSASADAMAAALAFASARSQAVVSGGGGFIEEVTRGGQGEIGGAAAVQEACVEQWATVVKAVHAICVDHWGHQHPATRMRPETWIDASYSGEIYRCLEGSWLRAVVGHVVESDEGTAAVYEGGDTLECKAGEGLRHFADGLVKCATAERVPDCTERSNLRRWGAGDIFFSFQEKVCAQSYSAYSASERMSRGGSTLELSNMTLSGGVGN